MKIVLLSSALPVRFGTLRQRLAYAQRSALQRFAEVSVITVDAWDSEWSARRFLREGDRFFGHARAKFGGGDGAFLRAGSLILTEPDTSNEGVLAEALVSGWMNLSRAARLSLAIASRSPDLVICADPILQRLAPSFMPISVPLTGLETGDADWARYCATTMRSRDEHVWFTQLAELATADRGGQGGIPASAIPIEQEESELFFVKSPSVLVPATGIHWLDRRILALLKTACTNLSRDAATVPIKVILVGFDAASAAQHCPGAELHRDWTRLHTMLGVARALFVPYMTPTLRPMVEASLKVGTPVLTRLSDKRYFELSGQDGLFAVLENHIASALEVAARGALTTERYCRNVSETARRIARSDAERTALLARALSGALGQEVSALSAPKPMPAARRSPLGREVVVLYNPVTKMLMVQAEIEGWGKLEELRLKDAHGHELTRLAPTAHQQAQRRYVIEGGIVTDLAPLGGAVRIEGYCDVEELFALTINAADFKRVEAGVTAFAHESGTLRATFWAMRDGGDTQWSARVGENTVTATRRGDLAIDDLGLDVWQARLPLPQPQPALFALTLLKADPASQWGEPICPPQKTFEIPAARALARASSTALGRLKDIHLGRRAWIVGNGPSVRLEDLARIPKDDIVFCFNRFYLSYDDNPLRETYVVSADTLMIQDFGQEMIDRSAGLPLFCIGQDHLAGLHGDYVRLPPGAASVPDFSFDPEHHVSVGGSSVYVALQMAWHMGIRDVVLYGMDYSFSATLVRDPRYPFPVSFDEGNHFIKAYRSAKPWCPPTWRDISAGFLNARIAFETTGGRVLNATRGGRLETFRRAEFDTLVSG